MKHFSTSGRRLVFWKVLANEQAKNGMAVLFENQAKELLREASSMAAGDVEGFASVAFPIVRRVFGGFIANDLVSVQPMSLPSGLIFFLDFAHIRFPLLVWLLVNRSMVVTLLVRT